MRKLIIPVFLFLMAGCTKEVEYNYNQATASNMEESKAAATYLPLKTGTYWKYTNQTDSNDPQTSTLSVLNLKKNYKGKTYTAVKTVRGRSEDTIYYSKTGHSYYIYTNESTPDASDMNLEILYLKDNAGANATWSASAGTAAGTSLTYYGKIIEKNMSIKVNGVTYDNVIHTYIEIRKPILFFYIVVAKQHYYIAKNIGIIKNVSEQELPSKSATTTTITDYTIK